MTNLQFSLSNPYLIRRFTPLRLHELGLYEYTPESDEPPYISFSEFRRDSAFLALDGRLMLPNQINQAEALAWEMAVPSLYHKEVPSQSRAPLGECLSVLPAMLAKG